MDSIKEELSALWDVPEISTFQPETEPILFIPFQAFLYFLRMLSFLWH